ncbi:hypothetical protein GCM10025886_14130 [Tetragenococcus halophilus subsp. flandriensis]|uniref:hypothetical protein n=1 Tax=Tetragenococcus halophilus TaxID=51669 RepID=UPI0023E994C9|nr:hypothetical protein [Tetragenococcus halophilus]GMA08262.1 hypothetical protein GCM10025886_14130 [Tetragenococcus halophilus subsp. flandriensis]
MEFMMLSLHSFLNEQGFIYVEDEITDEDYRQYFELCDRLKRTDLDFVPVLGGIYYKQISQYTILFVEKKVTNQTLRETKYDFYKQRRINGLGSEVIETYGEGLSYNQMFLKLRSFFRTFSNGQGGG